ncbi:hypothetical protein V1523DRAFT_416839 [Lipomyces doorenjongii]
MWTSQRERRVLIAFLATMPWPPHMACSQTQISHTEDSGPDSRTIECRRRCDCCYASLLRSQLLSTSNLDARSNIVDSSELRKHRRGSVATIGNRR